MPNATVPGSALSGRKYLPNLRGGRREQGSDSHFDPKFSFPMSSFRQGCRNPASRDGKLWACTEPDQVLAQSASYRPWPWIPALHAGMTGFPGKLRMAGNRRRFRPWPEFPNSFLGTPPSASRWKRMNFPNRPIIPPRCWRQACPDIHWCHSLWHIRHHHPGIPS
jgi:hypothetical protein